MAHTYFELYEDTTELREALAHADWELQFESEGERYYEVEIAGEDYYMVVYPDGSVVITDDPAVAFGDDASEYEYDGEV